MNTFLLLLLFLNSPFDNTRSDDDISDLSATRFGAISVTSAKTHLHPPLSLNPNHTPQYCQDTVKKGGMRYNIISFAFSLFVSYEKPTLPLPALSYALLIMSMHITSTKSLTKKPAFIPSQSPTFEPSQSPTFIPTLEPKFNPSSTPPTLEPTINPTNVQTNDPTYPSVSPTSTPTFSPSFSPTQNPTRYPTISRAYDSFFNITYVIRHLETHFIQILSQYITEVTADITEIIEQSYMEITGLRFQLFWLQIDDMLGDKIEDIDEKSYAHFLLRQNNITLGSWIKCDATNCEMLLNSEITQDFESIVQTKLRRYFPVYWSQLNAEAGNSSQLIFEIGSHGKRTEMYPAPITIFDVLSPHKVLVILTAVMVLMCIISCFSFCHLKGMCCCIPMDDTVWNVMMIYGLQLIVFASDINLCVELVFHKDFDTSQNIRICGISCIVFIVVPYVTNLFCGSKITSMISGENESAISFFKERKFIFMLLVVLCGGFYPAVFLLSSGIFGLELFCSGLTNSELLKMNKWKLAATICLNNIPQIVIQCIYATTIGAITPNTAFAFVAAFLSIISTPLRIRRTYSAVRALSYYMEIKIMSENDDDTDADQQKFVVNKGKINKMSQILCQAAECPASDIEISRNSKVFFSINFSSRQQATLGGSGVVLYVMHRADKHAVTERGILQLYGAREQFLKNEFKKHFGLNGACMIKFKSAGSSFKTLIDENKVNETNFGEMLKDMMDGKGLDYASVGDRNEVLENVYDNNGGKTTNVTNNGGEEEKQSYGGDIELQPLRNNTQSYQAEQQIFDGIGLNQQQEKTINDMFNGQLP